MRAVARHSAALALISRSLLVHVLRGVLAVFVAIRLQRLNEPLDSAMEVFSGKPHNSRKARVRLIKGKRATHEFDKFTGSHFQDLSVDGFP
jgi:hypothetical protein